MDLEIEELRKMCKMENIEITLHAAKRLEERGIVVADVIACIQNGAITEQYPTDYQFLSCLILGFSVANRYLHVVIGTNMETLWVVTAYYPNIDRWEPDYCTRKPVNKKSIVK